MEPTSHRRSGSLVTTNHFLSLCHVQHEHFLSDTTKSHDWRINQLSRTARMLLDNKVSVTTWWRHAQFRSLQWNRFGLVTRRTLAGAFDSHV